MAGILMRSSKGEKDQQVAGIDAVGLDRFASRRGNTAGRHHIAVHAMSPQVALKAKPTWSMFWFIDVSLVSRGQVVASTVKVLLIEDCPLSP